MKRRQYIFSLLLFACVAMVAASAIPHHHHGDSTICMKDDIAEDNCCGGTHHHPFHQHGNDLCCSDNCLTFFETPPGQPDVQHFQPHFQHITILYTEPLLRLLFRQEEKNTDRNRIYIELLHGAYYTCAVGLRAPPFLLS